LHIPTPPFHRRKWRGDEKEEMVRKGKGEWRKKKRRKIESKKRIDKIFKKGDGATGK